MAAQEARGKLLTPDPYSPPRRSGQVTPPETGSEGRDQRTGRPGDGGHYGEGTKGFGGREEAQSTTAPDGANAELPLVPPRVV